MHGNKNSSVKGILIYGLIIGIFLLFPKNSFAALYSPGETLDPACLPTDVDCGVYPSVSLTTSTYSVGDLLFASTTDSFGLLNIGLNGQFLKSTGSSIVWDSIPGGGDLLSGNNLSDVASSSTARSNLGLVIGTDIQAYNSGLADIAGLSLTNGNFIVSDGANWTAQSSSTVKTTLGLGNVENTALSLWAGSSNITTLGTIISGVWNGTKIVSSSLADNIMVEGENISLFNNNSGYVTSTEALALLSSNALGLTYNNTNGQFSLTTGYEIPNTASSTNWNNAYNIVNASSTNWDTAFGWGDHAGIGYLTSYSETDPIWNSVSSTYVTNTGLSNWAGSGNITTVGTIGSGTWQGSAIASTYLASNVMLSGENVSLLTNDSNYVTTTQATSLAKAAISTSGLALNYADGVISIASGYEIPTTVSSTNWNDAYNIVNASSTNWDTAFGWGDHSIQGYLTSYSETDPIWTAVSSTYLATTTASNTYLAITNNLSDLNNATTARTNLGLAIGTNVQAYNLGLFNIAGLTITEDAFIVGKDGEWVAESDSTARTSLGLGSVENTALSTWAGSSNITTLGTIVSGVWNGTKIVSSSLADNIMVEGENISLFNNNSGYVTSTEALALLSSNALGLTYNNTNGQFSLTSGYNIPLTVSTTNWNSTYDIVTASSSHWLLDSNDLSDLSNAVTARTNLGLGTISTQNSNNVSITGGVIDGTAVGATTQSTGFFTNVTTTGAIVVNSTGSSARLGGLPGAEATYSGLWLGGGTPSASNYAFLGWAQQTLFNVPNSGTADLEFRVGNAARFQVGGNGVSVNGTADTAPPHPLQISNKAKSANLLTLLDSGNVGIASSTPGYQFTIDGVTGATETALYITPSSDGTSERAALSLDNWNIGQDYNADGTKNFYIKDTASSTARFFIDKEGNIGVGTTTPQSAFHLASGSFTQTVGSDPVHLASVFDTASTTLDTIYGLDVHGKYLYAATNWPEYGMEILDVSDPSSPTHVGSLADTITSALKGNDIIVAGKYAYIASQGDNGVGIVDVSNPSDPVHVGSITDTAGTALASARAIDVSGQYAYVASYTEGVEILDISDPTNPKHMSSTTDDGTMLLNGAINITVSGHYAYVVSVIDNGIEILDISDPTNPTHVGKLADTVDTTLDFPKSIYVSGKYAYVASYNEGLAVLNISDPTNPIQVGSLLEGGSTALNGASDVKIAGNYAYVVSAFEGIEIADISDPTNPTHVTYLLDSAGTAFGGASTLDISGKYVYIAGFDDDGIEILDITGIEAPTANIGNINSNNISVTEDFDVGNDAYIGNGLVVGGNSLFGSAMSIAGGLTLHDNTASTTSWITVEFDHNTTTMWTMALDKNDDNFYIAGSSTESGVYLTQGSSGGWSSFSDERLKENIVDLNVLSRIDNYRAVSFDWKASGTHDVGAIAQELYEVFPEAVTVGSDELREGNHGSWGIQYSKLGALALEGVKELKQQLDVYNALLLTGGLDEFVGQMNQSNMLTFSQNVTFTNHVTFGIDNVGSAVILAGENAVRIEFSQEFTASPIVNLTLASDVTLDTYFVESVDTTGFTIRIRPVQGQDVVINWHAFGQVTSQSSETIINNIGSNSSSSDNLTDLANNYLEDNGLILDDTLTSSTESNTTTSTEEVINVIQEEIVEPLVTSTEENIIETTTSTNN